MIKERIKEGLEGKYEGLDNGLGRFNDYLFGVQRRCNTLMGGGSGTGKTTLVDYILFNAIQDAMAKGIELNIFYYSYEIDKLTKQCNWISIVIFNKYGIVIPPEKIKGLGKNNKLTDNEQLLVNEAIPEVEEMFKNINFEFEPTNPTGIRHQLWQFAESKGRIEFEDYIDANGDKKQKVKAYHPNNPDAYTIVVLDHLYHLKKERGFTTKDNIDKYSEYCVQLRNLFGFSFFNLQQFNQGLKQMLQFICFLQIFVVSLYYERYIHNKKSY